MYKTVYDAWPTSSPPRKITLKEKYVMKTKQFPSKKKNQKLKDQLSFVNHGNYIAKFTC